MDRILETALKKEELTPTINPQGRPKKLAA